MNHRKEAIVKFAALYGLLKNFYTDNPVLLDALYNLMGAYIHNPREKEVIFLRNLLAYIETEATNKGVMVSPYILLFLLDQVIEDQRLYTKDRVKIYWLNAVQYHVHKDDITKIINVTELDKAEDINSFLSDVIKGYNESRSKVKEYFRKYHG